MTLAEELGLTRAEGQAIVACACDLASAGHLQAAGGLLAGLLHLNPLDAAAWAAAGAIAWRLGEPAEAEAALRRALQLEPGHPAALATLRALGRAPARHQRLPAVGAEGDAASPPPPPGP